MRTYSRGGNPRRICYSEISGLPTWALARSDTRRRSSFRAIASLLGSKNSSAVLAIFWPGIDIDIPTKPNNSKCMPQSVKEAVLAAFRAGAPGVLLSRKYSEMRLANLSGAGSDSRVATIWLKKGG